MRFAGLALHDAVPDAKTIWLSREQLTLAGALATLSARFDAMLAKRGFLAMGGQIVDATVVEARRPRLTKDEKAILRDGGTPKRWPTARERRYRPRAPSTSLSSNQPEGHSRGQLGGRLMLVTTDGLTKLSLPSGAVLTERSIATGLFGSRPSGGGRPPGGNALRRSRWCDPPHPPGHNV
jgi:hypothetical protein